MPNPIERELGIDSTMHRFRRWVRNGIGRVGKGVAPQDERMLDPLTANYAAWNAVRRAAREWPHYTEAPNSIELYVSPDDWDDYWCIDTGRKEEGIAAYVRARAAEKGYWMAGDPQVVVLEDNSIDVGDIDVLCQFVEPNDERERPGQLSGTSQFDRIPVEERGPRDDMGTTNVTDATRLRADVPVARGEVEVEHTERFVDEESAGEACLVGENGFRLMVQSGDCIGAVRAGEEVPEEVNVRLDAAGFPYAAIKQCSLGIVGGRWTIVNHAPTGTKFVRANGRRYMLHEPEPFPIYEGDVIYLGPRRPLRFELS